MIVTFRVVVSYSNFIILLLFPSANIIIRIALSGEPRNLRAHIQFSSLWLHFLVSLLSLPMSSGLKLTIAHEFRPNGLSCISPIALGHDLLNC